MKKPPKQKNKNILRDANFGKEEKKGSALSTQTSIKQRKNEMRQSKIRKREKARGKLPEVKRRKKWEKKREIEAKAKEKQEAEAKKKKRKS